MELARGAAQCVSSCVSHFHSHSHFTSLPLLHFSSTQCPNHEALRMRSVLSPTLVTTTAPAIDPARACVKEENSCMIGECWQIYGDRHTRVVSAACAAHCVLSFPSIITVVTSNVYILFPVSP
jgi:hypothetical protein